MGDDVGSEESPSAAVGGVTRSAFEQERQRMKQEHILKEQAAKAAAQVSLRCQPCHQSHSARLPAVLLFTGCGRWARAGACAYAPWAPDLEVLSGEFHKPAEACAGGRPELCLTSGHYTLGCRHPSQSCSQKSRSPSWQLTCLKSLPGSAAWRVGASLSRDCLLTMMAQTMRSSRPPALKIGVHPRAALAPLQQWSGLCLSLWRGQFLPSLLQVGLQSYMQKHGSPCWQQPCIASYSIRLLETAAACHCSSWAGHARGSCFRLVRPST